MASNNAKLMAQLKALEGVPWIVPTAAAEKIAELARMIVPIDTGKLHDSIHAVHYSKHSNVVARANYAGFVEFGTYKMSAQPFLRPAIDEHRQEILNTVAEAVIGEIHVAITTGKFKYKVAA